MVSFRPTGTGLVDGHLSVDAWNPTASSSNVAETSMGLHGVGVEADTAVEDSSWRLPLLSVEDVVRELLSDKQRSFAQLLLGHAADVVNSKRVFDLTQDTERRLRNASILVSIDAAGARHREFLHERALVALGDAERVPWPVSYSDDGTTAPNAELVDWCQARGLSYWDIYRVAMYEFPSSWYFLAAAGDPSATEVLLKGLTSRNWMIVAMAAQGLAKLNDSSYIEPIVAAARRAPMRSGILQALIHFDDPAALIAARELAEGRNALLDAFIQEKERVGIRALFDW
jgi:hypothetical protein